MKTWFVCLALVLAVLVLLPAAEACKGKPNCPVFKKLCGEWRGEALDKKARISGHRLIKVVLRFLPEGKVEGTIGDMPITEGSFQSTGPLRRALKRDFMITGKLGGDPKHGGNDKSLFIAFDLENGHPDGEIMMGQGKGKDTLVWRLMDMNRLNLKS